MIRNSTWLPGATDVAMKKWCEKLSKNPFGHDMGRMIWLFILPKHIYYAWIKVR